MSYTETKLSQDHYSSTGVIGDPTHARADSWLYIPLFHDKCGGTNSRYVIKISALITVYWGLSSIPPVQSHSHEICG